MANAIDKDTSKWRNFASWSAAAGLVMLLFVAATSWLSNGDLLEGFGRLAAMDPKVALGLLLAIAVVGATSRNTAFAWRSFGYFLILSATAGAIGVLALSGLRPLVDNGTFGAMGVSQWAAVGVGLLLLFLAVVIIIALATARRGLALLDAEQAETLRERRHLLVLSWITMAAMGLLLILLGLAGPGSMLSPAAVLAGALVLLALVTGLSLPVWRLMDELDRTLSYESGTIAFYLILLFGGGWAMLAHLRFVAPAAPLDWLTMFTVLMFAASFIAAGRRGLLKSR